MQGKWEQLKGAAKHSWGNLTDDDFAKSEGSVEKLYGIIHEKFGDTKEAIKNRLESNGFVIDPSQGKSANDNQEKKGPDNETHMMRGALRALFAVGVVMVLFRISRRVLRGSK